MGSAVTGGIGSEELTDFTQKVVLNIPTSPTKSLNVDFGYDYYTSVSTDQIDNIPSSDSRADLRAHANVGMTMELNPRQTLSFRGGGSVEYDYTSFNGSISVARVLNKRWQVFLQAEGIYMNGLLSTPFHRVYFNDATRAGLEQLPDTRLKIPVGVRLNGYLAEWLVARFYYRYYWDNWGVQGHTGQVELPLKIGRFLSISPSYRIHTQTAADYFAPYREHVSSAKFRTSDFDLSELTSQSYGLGITYSPAKGLGKLKFPFSKGNHLKLDRL